MTNKTGMSVLDHGILNVPLAKRGNIDAQIGRFKAEEARKDRLAGTATFHQVREQKKRVRNLLARIGDHRIMALANPLGCRTPRTAREALYRAAVSNLPRWIAVLEREKFPGGCAKCWAPLGECSHSDEEWMGPA
jgi:hypothetical protein